MLLYSVSIVGKILPAVILFPFALSCFCMDFFILLEITAVFEMCVGNISFVNFKLFTSTCRRLTCFKYRLPTVYSKYFECKNDWTRRIFCVFILNQVYLSPVQSDLYEVKGRGGVGEEYIFLQGNSVFDKHEIKFGKNPSNYNLTELSLRIKHLLL